jgi:hypothetical protein
MLRKLNGSQSYSRAQTNMKKNTQVDDENKISIEPVKLYMYITIDADLGRRWVGDSEPRNGQMRKSKTQLVNQI